MCNKRLGELQRVWLVRVLLVSICLSGACYKPLKPDAPPKSLVARRYNYLPARQGPADSVLDENVARPLRAAVGVPDEFVVVDYGPETMEYTPCALHLRDERDSTVLTLMASFDRAGERRGGDASRAVYGGYETTPSERYGLRDGEMLRVACRRIRP
jgi:hypothetical protein